MIRLIIRNVVSPTMRFVNPRAPAFASNQRGRRSLRIPTDVMYKPTGKRLIDVEEDDDDSDC